MYLHQLIALCVRFSLGFGMSGVEAAEAAGADVWFGRDVNITSEVNLLNMTRDVNKPSKVACILSSAFVISFIF